MLRNLELFFELLEVFLLHIGQTNVAALFNWDDLSFNPVGLHGDKLFFIELDDFESDLVGGLAESFVTQILPLFEFLFVDWKPLFFAMLFKSFGLRFGLISQGWW